MSEAFDVVDVLERETAELPEETDVTLVFGDEQVFVLKPRDD